MLTVAERESMTIVVGRRAAGSRQTGMALGRSLRACFSSTTMRQKEREKGREDRES